MSHAKDRAALFRHLREHGYDITRSPGGHFRITDQAGVLIGSVSHSPSDGRAARNTLSDLYARGVPRLPGRYTPPKQRR